MYKIYDKEEAIKNVQNYLRLVGSSDIFVAPTGVYDDNTRLSVADFQSRNGIASTGEVDLATFDLLFAKYEISVAESDLRSKTDSFISFPITPGQTADEMTHINNMISRLLDYYGFSHRIRSNRSYSDETAKGVEILRKVYQLDDEKLIDEALYLKMIRDHDSIGRVHNNFN